MNITSATSMILNCCSINVFVIGAPKASAGMLHVQKGGAAPTQPMAAHVSDAGAAEHHSVCQRVS